MNKVIGIKIYLLALVLLALFPELALAGDPVEPPEFDDQEIKETICQIYDLMEGSLGAFLTTVAGVGAVVASAFGAYRAGFSLIVVATSSFIMHSLVDLWFQDYDCVPVDPTELRASESPSDEEIERRTETVVAPAGLTPDEILGSLGLGGVASDSDGATGEEARPPSSTPEPSSNSPSGFNLCQGLGPDARDNCLRGLDSTATNSRDSSATPALPPSLEVGEGVQ